MTPGIVLEALLGAHSGPRVRPFVPVSAATLRAVADAGYRFVQFGPMARTTPARCAEFELATVASVTWHLAPGDRDLKRSLRSAADAGHQLASLLVGSGLTSRDDASRRVEELLSVADEVGIPVCLETHRATITESIWQTLWLAEQFPSLRFNLDLSHWFVTHRLDRVEVSEFVERTSPVLSRCRLVHGRIASNDEIQVAVDGANGAEFFREVWAQVRSLSADAWFAPELLPAWMGYAQDDRLGDRWQDAATLCQWVTDV